MSAYKNEGKILSLFLIPNNWNVLSRVEITDPDQIDNLIASLMLDNQINGDFLESNPTVRLMDYLLIRSTQNSIHAVLLRMLSVKHPMAKKRPTWSGYRIVDLDHQLTILKIMIVDQIAGLMTRWSRNLNFPSLAPSNATHVLWWVDKDGKRVLNACIGRKNEVVLSSRIRSWFK